MLQMAWTMQLHAHRCFSVLSATQIQRLVAMESNSLRHVRELQECWDRGTVAAACGCGRYQCSHVEVMSSNLETKSQTCKKVENTGHSRLSEFCALPSQPERLALFVTFSSVEVYFDPSHEAIIYPQMFRNTIQAINTSCIPEALLVQNAAANW